MALTAAQKKAQAIMDAEDKATLAYQAAKTAPAKTQAEVDAINAGVKVVTESTVQGKASDPAGQTPTVYDSSKDLTVLNQVSINPDVRTTNNISSGSLKSTVGDDAFLLLNTVFKNLGIDTLGSTIQQLLTQGYDSDTVLTKVKFDTSINPATNKAWNNDYTVRFAGNEARKAKGLNVLDEGTYLKLENSYSSTLRAYGLGNMISPDAKTNYSKFAQWIGSDLSAEEFAGRIDTVSTRITNADPAVLNNFKQYYPELNKTDLISYFLAPDESLPLLKQKITASEIGAAANQYGFATDKARAEEFAKMGETYGQAQADYGKIAEVLPTSQKLSNIYGEEKIDYNLRAGEDEFIKNDAEAKLKRNRLASKERATFAGQAGTSQQFSSVGKSVQGRF